AAGRPGRKLLSELSDSLIPILGNELWKSYKRVPDSLFTQNREPRLASVGVGFSHGKPSTAGFQGLLRKTKETPARSMRRRLSATKISRPFGVEVSTPSCNEMKSTPRLRN